MTYRCNRCGRFRPYLREEYEEAGWVSFRHYETQRTMIFCKPCNEYDNESEEETLINRGYMK